MSYQVPVTEKQDLQARLPDLVTNEQSKVPQLGILALTVDAVSGRFVDTFESLRAGLEDFNAADAVVLDVERSGNLRYLVLEADK